MNNQTSRALHSAAQMAMKSVENRNPRGVYVVRNKKNIATPTYHLNIKGEILCIVAIGDNDAIRVIRFQRRQSE
jgi:hypothetical protein